MKKHTIGLLFLLFVISILATGCGTTEEVTNTNEVNSQTTTTYLVDTQNRQVEKTQEVVVARDAEKNIFLQSGVDAIIEFYNNDEQSKRLVIYETNVDVLLRPNERVELKINAKPQTIEYLFGDDYKQIIIV